MKLLQGFLPERRCSTSQDWHNFFFLMKCCILLIQKFSHQRSVCVLDCSSFGISWYFILFPVISVSRVTEKSLVKTYSVFMRSDFIYNNKYFSTVFAMLEWTTPGSSFTSKGFSNTLTNESL